VREGLFLRLTNGGTSGEMYKWKFGRGKKEVLARFGRVNNPGGGSGEVRTQYWGEEKEEDIPSQRGREERVMSPIPGKVDKGILGNSQKKSGELFQADSKLEKKTKRSRTLSRNERPGRSSISAGMNEGGKRYYQKTGGKAIRPEVERGGNASGQSRKGENLLNDTDSKNGGSRKKEKTDPTALSKGEGLTHREGGVKKTSGRHEREKRKTKSRLTNPKNLSLNKKRICAQRLWNRE